AGDRSHIVVKKMQFLFGLLKFLIIIKKLSTTMFFEVHSIITETLTQELKTIPAHPDRIPHGSVVHLAEICEQLARAAVTGKTCIAGTGSVGQHAPVND